MTRPSDGVSTVIRYSTSVSALISSSVSAYRPSPPMSSIALTDSIAERISDCVAVAAREGGGGAALRRGPASVRTCAGPLPFPRGRAANFARISAVHFMPGFHFSGAASPSGSIMRTSPSRSRSRPCPGSHAAGGLPAFTVELRGFHPVRRSVPYT